jgi:8-oxo-dGTP pyrophosphatase MutT (NUDIX family)
MARMRSVQVFSAGGVVFRPATEAVSSPRDVARAPDAAAAPASAEIALVSRARLDLWVLPKGTPRSGEDAASTALREVREETGLITRIVGELGSIHYTFVRNGKRFHKEVFHYLLEATGGDVSLHDAEYDEARWFPLDEAYRRLTFQNEAELVQRAAPLIARFLAGLGTGTAQDVPALGLPSAEESNGALK